MKKIFAFPFLVVTLLMLATTVSFAQLREKQEKPSDFTGPVVKEHPSEGARLGNLFNMTMDHSYSMMFGSFGGQFQNLNAYTNTMHFFFSERMTGRVDLSVLHSPFGNSYLNAGGTGAEVDFIIRNAELNYQLSERSRISVSFQQVPAYGYGYGYGYGAFSPSPFFNHAYNDRNY